MWQYQNFYKKLIRRKNMKNRFFAMFVLMMIFAIVPNIAQAGFFSTFFANVASDSLKSDGTKAGVHEDPTLKEKKIQGALGVMGYYEMCPDGDLNTFESRVAIKKFQEKIDSEQTGMLSETEKEQLLYLSNLYTGLKMPGLENPKKYSIYNEIDETIESMRKKAFYEKYLNYFDSSEKVRIVGDVEEAAVLIDGEKVGEIMLGYNTQMLKPKKYDIKLEMLSKDGEWLYSGSKTIEVKDGVVGIVEVITTKNETPKRINRIKKETEIALINEKNELEDLAKKGLKYEVNSDGTITDVNLGITWMRCSLGQVWNGYTCIEDQEYKGMDKAIDNLNAIAKQEGKSEWRIPKVEELQSLIYCSSGEPNYRNTSGNSCSGAYQSPTIAQALFPNTPKARFWTSSIVQVFFRTEAKFINFEKGYVTQDSQGRDSLVRLVRSMK